MMTGCERFRRPVAAARTWHRPAHAAPLPASLAPARGAAACRGRGTPARPRPRRAARQLCHSPDCQPRRFWEGSWRLVFQARFTCILLHIDPPPCPVVHCRANQRRQAQRRPAHPHGHRPPAGRPARQRTARGPLAAQPQAHAVRVSPRGHVRCDGYVARAKPPAALRAPLASVHSRRPAQPRPLWQAAARRLASVCASPLCCPSHLPFLFTFMFLVLRASSSPFGAPACAGAVGCGSRSAQSVGSLCAHCSTM